MTESQREHELCQKARQALRGSAIYSLHLLEVAQIGENIVVSGRVESYYHKQMAQEAIRAEMPTIRLVNAVQVK